MSKRETAFWISIAFLLFAALLGSFEADQARNDRDKAELMTPCQREKSFTECWKLCGKP